MVTKQSFLHKMSAVCSGFEKFTFEYILETANIVDMRLGMTLSRCQTQQVVKGEKFNEKI